MAEGESEDGTTGPVALSKLDSAPRIGRAIATALFWCCAIYLAAAGFYSIPAQVFAPEAAATPPAPTCAQGIRILRRELLEHASEQVAAGGRASHPPMRSWLHEWDRRYVALGGLCHDRGTRAYAATGRMRHGVEATLRRFDAMAPVNRDIDRGLRSLTSNTQEDSN